MSWAGPAPVADSTPIPTDLAALGISAADFSGTHLSAGVLADPEALTQPLTALLEPGPDMAAAWLNGRVPVSATLAANEALARRRQNGESVLPLAFGEAGLPVHPRLSAELSDAASRGEYGPVAGAQRLREAAAGYWARRSLPTSPDAVVAGPGSKALLFAVLMAIATDVAVPMPSWVSYAAQARLIGAAPRFVPTPPGEGGICDPDALAAAVTTARACGRPIGAVLVTMPDNPTGRLASPEAVRELCTVAERYNLIIISDEIYRDLVHDPATPFLSPAVMAPHRTVVTTALSKSLAVGGWRIGVARMPDGSVGSLLRERVLGIASEVWSAAAGPVQHAAAIGFDEPADLADRVTRSRALHAAVCREAAKICATAGLEVAAPQAAFYLYPDFAAWRTHLAGRFAVTTGADLATLLLERYGAGSLPASAFGESASALRLRLATGMLYGDTDEQRETALAAANPLCVPWLRDALNRLAEILADLGP